MAIILKYIEILNHYVMLQKLPDLVGQYFKHKLIEKGIRFVVTRDRGVEGGIRPAIKRYKLSVIRLISAGMYTV